MKIKANHITIVRILFLPVPCYIFLNYPSLYLEALIFFIILGATDWFDGWLARRQGPTTLGSLLDPIADKIFIALTYIPMSFVKLSPYWFAVVIFFREFSITVLRSLTARADIVFKTSKIAKYKTAIQMGAAGFILWIAATYKKPFLMYIGLLSLIFGTLLLSVLLYIKKRKITDRILSAIFFFSLVPILLKFTGKEITYWIAFVVVILFTYISAIDYIVGLIKGIRKALKRGNFSRFIVTLFETIILPVYLLATGLYIRVNPWLIMGITSIELSIGGLDNLLASKKLIRSISWIWVKTVLLFVVSIFIFIQSLKIYYLVSFNLLFSIALSISFVYAIVEFIKYRNEYL